MGTEGMGTEGMGTEGRHRSEGTEAILGQGFNGWQPLYRNVLQKEMRT